MYQNEGTSVVALEGLFAIIVIDAQERREVATFGVPGAYLHADMPKNDFFI